MKNKITLSKEGGCKEAEMQYKLRSKTKSTSNDDLPQKKATENMKPQQVSSRQRDSALKSEKNQAIGRGRKSVCKRNKDGHENERAGLGKPKSRGNPFLSPRCVELGRDVPDSRNRGVPESSTDHDPSCLNLPQKPIDKEKEQHDCMKIKASFWVLNDDIIRAVQQKLRTSENQTSIQQEQECAQAKLTAPRSFPESRASGFLPGSAGDAAATKKLESHSAFQRFDLCLDRVDTVMAYSLGSSYSDSQSGNSEDTELVENSFQQALIDAIVAPTTPEGNALNSEEIVVHSETASEISFSPGRVQELVFEVSEKIGPLCVSEVSEATITTTTTQNEGVANEIRTMTTVVPVEVETQVRSPVTLATSPEMTSEETVCEMSAIVTKSSEGDYDSPVNTTILMMSGTLNTCTVNKQNLSCDESMEEGIVVSESDVCKLVSVSQNAPADQENSSDDDNDAMEMDFEEQTVCSDDEINVSSKQRGCVSDASGSFHQICENVDEILEVKQTQETDFETGPHFSTHFDTNLVRNTELEKLEGGHNLSLASRCQDCEPVEIYECENIDRLKAPLHVPIESPRKALHSGAECCSITNNVSEGSEKVDLNHDATICVPEEEISHSINNQDQESTGPSMQKSVATCSKRNRKRRPKIKFTWKKIRKCQAFQPSLTRLMSVGSGGDDPWNFQQPITDQVLSGSTKISPDVQNAASVLAMMKGNLFSTPIKSSAPNTSKSKMSDSDVSLKFLSAARVRPRAGAYFCNVCGHTSEELDLHKKHMIIHRIKRDVNKELVNLDENSSNVTVIESDCETTVIGGETVDLSQPSQSLSMVLHKQNVPKLIINMRIEKIGNASLTNSSGGNADRTKQTSITVSRKVLAEALKEILKDNYMSGSSRKMMTDSASRSGGCRQVPVRTKSIENIPESITSSEVEKDLETISCEKPVLVESSDDSSNEEDSRTTQTGNTMEECNETSKGENDLHDEPITVQDSSSASGAIEPNFHVVEDTTNSGIKISQLSDFATDVNSRISESRKHEGKSLVLNSSTCIICNHQFSSPANMRKHVRMKHNLYRPHKCPTCGKGFPYPSSLEEHMIIHSANPKRMQICDMCGKDFVRASGLRKHVKEHHENLRPYICHICEKGYIYLSALKEHLRSHSEDRTFKCSQCDSEFKHASNLLTHMKKTHGKNCSCPAGCCTCFSKTPKAQITLDCKMCSRTFSGKRQLKIHMRIHGNKAHLICKLCNTEFPNKFLLTKHRLKHKETQSYDCVVCSRSFLSYQSLKIHQNGHNGIKPYQCENCGKQYSTKSSLKIHSVKHTNSNLYTCGSCNKKFAVKEAFTDHVCNRSKDPVFVCNFCNERFKTSSELRKHLMIHEEQKKFVCLFCSKKFLHESNLRMHIVKHTGERPHSCSVCGRCFSLKTNLNRHMQLHRRKNGHIIAESAIPIPGAYVILSSQ